MKFARVEAMKTADVFGEKMRKKLANIITSFRIVCSVCLLFCPLFSDAFYFMYLFCGITDMVDGTIARKTNTVSDFGARLDTVADMVFMAVCFVKILPFMNFLIWLWIWIAVIAAMKIGIIIWGFISSKKLISLHTLWNKTTGVFLFVLPLTLDFIEPMYSFVVVCFFAMLSAINEVYQVKKGRELL